MTKKELLERLKHILERPYGDADGDHHDADDAIIEYIGDPEIQAAYEEVEKWYS